MGHSLAAGRASPRRLARRCVGAVVAGETDSDGDDDGDGDGNDDDDDDDDDNDDNDDDDDNFNDNDKLDNDCRASSNADDRVDGNAVAVVGAALAPHPAGR